MKTLWTLAISALATLACALAVAQSEATLVPAQSELVFQFKQMGVPVEGRFRKFAAQIAIDPKKPESGRVAFQVDTASATIGAAEVDLEMVKPVWFNVARFPQASFQSTGIKGLGGGRFDVAGKLTIKGHVRDIAVPVTLTSPPPGSAVSSASGNFTLKRVDFLIGEKEWADVSLVANDVQVRFKLALSGLAAQ